MSGKTRIYPASVANDAPVFLRVVASAAKELSDREFPIPGRQAWIGRGDDCDVVVKDSNMSRRHAKLEIDPSGSLLVSDNNSSNGIVVGGRRVAEGEVLPGQRFTLGGTTFELMRRDVLPTAVAPEAGTILDLRIADLAAQLEKPRSLDEQGEEIDAMPSRPLMVDDPNFMWLVASGRVDLFTIALEDGQQVGTRKHFLTIEAGQAFFGIDTDRFGFEWAFIAVGRTGTQLQRYPLDQLQFLGRIPAHRGRLAQMVEKWVEELSRRLTQGFEDIPETQVELEADVEAKIEVSMTLASKSEVLWLKMPPAHFLFDSTSSFSYEMEGLLFPLAKGSWIELLASDRELTLEPKTTLACIRDARLWAGLDEFYRLLCDGIHLSQDFAHADLFLQQELKARHADRAQEAALGEIESVLGGAENWRERPLGDTDMAPLLAACQLIGDVQGIEVKPHPHARQDLGLEDALADIATVSHFRTRQIKLSDEWWNHDQGPMLGVREEDQAPVALLPTSTKSYDCLDPASGLRTQVTSEVAFGLAGFGHVFYVPLPPGSLSTGDVLRFAVRGQASEFRSIGLMGLAVGLLSTVTPLITGKVYDAAIPQAEREMLTQFTLGLFIVALTTAAFQITQKIATLRLQGKMDYTVQAAVWDRLLDLPMTFFRDFSAGDLADRAAGVAKIRSIIAGTGVAAILGSIASLFNAVQMAMYSFTLAVVGALLSLTYVLLTIGASYIQILLERKELWRTGQIRGLVLQLIGGVSKLRVCGAENHAFRVWASQFAGQRKVAFRVGRVSNFVQVLNSGFALLANMAIFATLVYLKNKAAENGEKFDMSTGDYLAFSAAFGMFQSAMQALGDASINLLKIVPTFERLQPILEAEPEVDNSKEAPGLLEGRIKVSHVDFRYTSDGPRILKNLSLEINPGEFIGIVGGSGSGKSTLLRLMLGFETPSKGIVYYDDDNLETLDIRMVRQQIGVVLQDSRVLPAEIYRNIVGASSRSVEDAWEAARKAGLDKDIRMMPMKMHTYVSEGGGGLSGGQKQRLMIARALVNSPRILFLDEATSALDNEAQATVTQSMDGLHATRIVIAHRLSTIKNADRICYLEEGTIREQGTYDELMEMDGLFAQMAKRQLV